MGWKAVIIIAVIGVALVGLNFVWHLYPGSRKWLDSDVNRTWAQVIVLAVTLIYLIDYVYSTRSIAEATQQQLAIAQEPVVSIELRMVKGASTNWVILPTMVNKSANHARCWLRLELTINGQPRPGGHAYDGTSGWIVQAGHIVNGKLEVAELAAEKQNTATITLSYQRLDGTGRRQEVGPLRYSFSPAEGTWILDIP